MARNPKVTEQGWDHRYIGDVYVPFLSQHIPASGRQGLGDWDILEMGESQKIFCYPSGRNWKGFPLWVGQESPWGVLMIGELTGYTLEHYSPRDLLADLLHPRRCAETLNGHCLIMAWTQESQEWHVWTDRFGTVHAYHTSNGRQSGLSTVYSVLVHQISRGKLDWVGLCQFFAYGFFLDDRTHCEGIRILQPASHYVFDKEGCLVNKSRYWEWWHTPDQKRCYQATVEQFGSEFTKVLAEQARGHRIAVAVSGGLDSRTIVAALTAGDGGDRSARRYNAYSYGYQKTSIETRIGRRVADARGIPFSEFTIQPYLFDRLKLIVSCVECFQDLTQCRQAGVVDRLSELGDSLLLGHWGDVWMDTGGLSTRGLQSRVLSDEDLVTHVDHKFAKKGSEWLVKHLCQNQLGEFPPHDLLRECLRSGISRYRDIADPDFRVKAYKTDQWSFRWTVSSLRMFQPSVYPRVPFYDTRLVDFFCTVPSEFMYGRRLQIDYLKQFAPDLAHIVWQPYSANLYWYQYFNSLLLPKRVFERLARASTGTAPIERNWEIQFWGREGRSGLEGWLIHKGLRLHEFVDSGIIKELLREFYASPLEDGRGYTVCMLLTFSAWLEHYA